MSGKDDAVPGPDGLEIGGEGPLVVLTGNVDARTSAAVRTELYARLARHDDVVVDLSQVPGVDVVALRVLAIASRQAARQGGVLTLRGCRGPVLRLLHLSHLRRLVAVERASAPV